MLTPRTPIPPLIKVPQEQYKPNKHSDQPTGAHNPPRPPKGLAALEKANGLLDEFLEARGDALIMRGINGAIRRLVDADAFAEGLWGVQEADAEDEAHQEAADMREVVETWEQTEDEGDGYVEEEEEEVFHGGAARVPVVEEVEEDEGEDAEKGA